MKVKPHGIWYLLPVVIAVGAVIISISLFSKGIDATPTDIDDFSLGQWYEGDFVEGEFIAFFVDELEVDEYLISGDNGLYTLTMYQDLTATTYTLEIENLSGTISRGFNVEEFENTEENTIVTDINFMDINFTEDGSYRYRITADTSADVDYGYLVFTMDTTFGYVYKAIMTMFIGIPLGIVVFIVVLILRISSKRKVKQYQAARY